ncbi:Protein of unknown function [Gryllus bimaculatus]|nr:Protein of unknown function [Gryllus bimaculatus]
MTIQQDIAMRTDGTMDVMPVRVIKYEALRAKAQLAAVEEIPRSQPPAMEPSSNRAPLLLTFTCSWAAFAGRASIGWVGVTSRDGGGAVGGRRDAAGPRAPEGQCRRRRLRVPTCAAHPRRRDAAKDEDSAKTVPGLVVRAVAWSAGAGSRGRSPGEFLVVSEWNWRFLLLNGMKHLSLKGKLNSCHRTCTIEKT